MILSDASIARPVMAAMLAVALVVFGVIGLTRLPVRELPDVDKPIVSVNVAYPGASPEVVEQDVVEILEEELNTVEGVETMESSSSDGSGSITMTFDLARDIDVAAQEVRERVASARRRLPETVEEPLVRKEDPNARPIMWWSLNAADRDRVELTDYADRLLKPRLETLPGVGRVQIGGEQAFSVRVWIDPERMAARGVTVDDVARALREQNQELPSGRIEGLERDFTVQTAGTLGDVAAFESLFLGWHDGGPVRLGDVARIVPGARDERASARFTAPPHVVGRTTVGLGIVKQQDANTVAVAQAVREEMAAIRAELPAGFEINLAFDGSTFIEESIAEVREALILGGILTVAVIFLFLGSLRTTLIAAVSIPTSVLATFGVMYAFGFSINVLSMLALVLAVGLVIDDAIVVLENVFRHREMGKGRMAAAIDGTRQIAFAAITATASIAAVFLPLAFVGGTIGRLFSEFALTVAAAVLISLFVALTVVPMLCSRFLAEGEGGRLARLIERGTGALAGGYARVLGGALRLRLLVLVVLGGVLWGTWTLYQGLGQELTPQADEGSVIVWIKGPVGASLEHMESSLGEVERHLAQVPEVATAFTAVGLFGGVDSGIAFVRLKPLAQRRAEGLRSQAAVIGELWGRFSQVPGLLAFPSGRSFLELGGRGGKVQLALLGSDLHELSDAAEALMAGMRADGGFVQTRSDFDADKPKIAVRPLRERAAELGVSPTVLADTMRVLLGGDDVGWYQAEGERYDVMVQAERAQRSVPEDLSRLHVRAADGAMVPLDQLVRVEETVGPSSIPHYGRSRTVPIQSDATVPLGEALARVRAIAADTLPPGIRVVPKGEALELEESMASMAFAFVLAVVVIYMLLASQFNHFVHPFTIMLSLPLALMGAFGLLHLKGLTLNVFSVIGLIMLIGLVTKNAILLVDYANQRRREGLVRDAALIEAGRVRLRPILMTAASTVLGVLPALIGVGSGSENRQPLAAAVVGGMVTATLLTLFVIPAVYALLDDVLRLLRLAPRDAAAAPVAPAAHAEGAASVP